jgi:hypothetical protein
MYRRITFGAAAAASALAMFLLAMASAPRPALAAGANGEIQTGKDLLDVCSDPSDSSAIACKFYVLGALQAAAIMHAADTGQTDQPLYCAGNETTTGDLVKAVENLVKAHPERQGYPAASIVVGGAMEAYPCKGAPKSSHQGHHSKRHSSHTH